MNKPANKLEFYNTFKSDDKSVIEKGIEQLKSIKTSTLNNAYLGALTMKSAQFPSTPKEKIKVLKGKIQKIEVENDMYLSWEFDPTQKQLDVRSSWLNKLFEPSLN